MDLDTRELNNVLRDMIKAAGMEGFFSNLSGGDSDMPSFNLKRGQHKYLYVGEYGRTQYCYTPHRAEDGYFYTFQYVEFWTNPKLKTKKGRAAMRPGELMNKVKLVGLTKARSRKLAQSRAWKRYCAAAKAGGWRVTPRGSLIQGPTEPQEAVPA